MHHFTLFVMFNYLHVEAEATAKVGLLPLAGSRHHLGFHPSFFSLPVGTPAEKEHQQVLLKKVSFRENTCYELASVNFIWIHVEVEVLTTLCIEDRGG